MCLQIVQALILKRTGNYFCIFKIFWRTEIFIFRIFTIKIMLGSFSDKLHERYVILSAPWFHIVGSQSKPWVLERGLNGFYDNLNVLIHVLMNY